MNLRHLGLHRAAGALEARQQPHHHDGDSNGGGVDTLISIVFVTATPTFSGPVAGFSTNFGGPPAVQTGDSSAATTQPSEPTEPQTTQQPQSQQQHTTSHEQPSSNAQASQTAVASTNVQSQLSQPTTQASSNAFPTSANGNDGFATAAATSSPTASSSSSNSNTSSQGTSSGAKAGIAIGVILGLAALAALAFLGFRYYKEKKEKREDEKSNPFGNSASSAAMPPPPAPAPQMSQGYAPPPMAAMQAEFTRPSTAGTNGPFSNSHAAPSIHSIAQPEPPVNPFGEHAQIGSQTSLNGSLPLADDLSAVSPISEEKEIIGAAFGAAALGAAAGGMATSRMSEQDNTPMPLELDGNSRPMPAFAGPPKSPSPSQYSFSSAAPSGAAAAGGAAQASNVHRVQLDFHPSMHDEMELRQGELVRMLHEYDDGWALCVKFDKSARGVCPRTCLSQKPLQPRGAPRGGAPRGGPAGPGPLGSAPFRTASPAPSTGPRNGPVGAGPDRTASPAPSGFRIGGPPSRTASPAPPAAGPQPGSRSASPAPAQLPAQLPAPVPVSAVQAPPASPLAPNLSNWPAKPVNASTIKPHMNNWPAQPVNFKPDMTKRSMSPGPYGGAAPRPMGPVKRRSQSVGNISAPSPGPQGPLPELSGSSLTSMTSTSEFQLPIMGGSNSPGPVARKPVPGQ